ncbi:glutamine-hydrolyzing carbamoyl-phosphate synthase small subunit, partial [Pseudomonadota bacterium]
PESITDPSYQGQILTFTYPLIGNYGIPSNSKDKHGISEFFESGGVKVKGVVVSEYAEKYSHWNAKQSLSQYLKKAGIPGITGVDTRAITKIIRTKGCMPGKIIVNGGSDLPFIDPNLENLAAQVSVKKPVLYKGGRKKLVVIDCGVKNNTIRNFLNRGLSVLRVPWNYDFIEAGERIAGVYVSNGPGDPALLKETIEIVKKCFKKGIPTFGICLGNQVMGLAAGAKTYKLKYGHRAQNQPCVNSETGKCYMTSQNHGFAIDGKTLPRDWKVWFTQVNDGTIEGIKHHKRPFMAVQFHPEADPGPTDTENLFDEFVKLL